MSDKHWSETEEGQKQLIDILNETYWLQPDDIDIRKDEYCKKCKNEIVACVCMEIDDE